MPRVYNALSGFELAKLTLLEVEQKLELDPRFGSDTVVESALMAFTLHIDSYPSGEQQSTFDVQVSEVQKGVPANRLPATIVQAIRNEISRDLRFGNHVTYHQVTNAWRINFKLNSETSLTPVERVVEPSTPEPGRPLQIDTRGPVLVRPHEPSPLSEREKRIADLRRQLSEVEAGWEEGAAIQEAPREPIRHNFEKITGTGLEIEAGWGVSPGPHAAESWGGGRMENTTMMGTIAGTKRGDQVILPSDPDYRQIVTRGELGGGMREAIPPDQARRDAGLYVPQTQVIKSGDGNGMMVDVPLSAIPPGTF